MPRAFETPIVLPGDPTSANHASNKNYVDNGLAAKAPIASPTFTGTVIAPKLVCSWVALTDAATIAVDASLGIKFAVTLGGNRSMAAPSNPSDGQTALFRIRQDGTGNRTLSWTSGAGGYSFGSDITAAPTLSTAINKVDYVGFIYDATNDRWHLLSYARGY